MSEDRNLLEVRGISFSYNYFIPEGKKGGNASEGNIIT
jgi:hypothetical protein